MTNKTNCLIKKKIANKNKSIFESIYCGYYRLIYIYINEYNIEKYGIHADDVFQETIIRLWKVVNGNKILIKPNIYIKKIVRSIIIDKIRLANKERVLFESFDFRSQNIGHNHFRSNNDKTNSQLDIINKARESINSSRGLVIFYIISGYSIKEISEMFNWTIKKTYHLYDRGLNDIRKILSK